MDVSDREMLEYLSSFLEMLCSLHWAPSCSRKTATIPPLSHLKVAWAPLLRSTVLGHLSWIPNSNSWVPWLQRFASAAEINAWVRGLGKEECEFPGLLVREAASERSSDNMAYWCSSWDNVSVWHPTPLQLRMALDPGAVSAQGMEM